MSILRNAVIVPPELPQRAGETTAERPWPLRLLSAKIAEYIARMDHIWVEGEVTSIKRRPNAKVQYFQLADLQASPQITITIKMWSHALPASIREGMHVVAWVKPDFWEGSGSFTLHAETIQEVGLGAILARIEALKVKLAAEGLFAASRKKPLPFLPRTIGLIVGRNTEAEKDVVVNASQRWPSVKFSIQQVQVQGNGAAAAVIGALAELDADPEIDVIVIARGGGSPEDLLPFSDEALVRAVSAATTPIVSAIGHEADNPLLDFVADVRASTPTDAARRIVPDVSEERTSLQADLARGRHSIFSAIHLAQADITHLRHHPALAQPGKSIQARADELANLIAWGRAHAENTVHSEHTALCAHVARLRTLSPFSTLKRGYAILRDAHRTPVGSVEQIHKGAELSALMHNGELALTVQAIHTNETE